ASAEKGGGFLLGSLLGEKITGGVTAIVSYLPGGWMQQSPAVLRCAILSVGSTEASGSEAARVHHAARQRGGRVAAGGTRAATGKATDSRVSRRSHACDLEPVCCRLWSQSRL